MLNFDRYIGIDWSGSKELYTPSISVAQCLRGNQAPQLIYNPTGMKNWSRYDVARWIIDLAKNNKRTLVGVDANFGYCHAIGQKHFGKNYNARDHWRTVDQASLNSPNFYAEPFWQSEKYTNDFWQTGKKPQWFNADKLRRETEIQCIKDGYGHPESPFKICYAKQVGKGGLATQRMAHYLLQKLKNKFAVWPFDTPKYLNKASIVMTEIYPRQFIRRAGLGNLKIRNGEIDKLNQCYQALGSDKCHEDFNFSDHDSDALVSAAGLRYLCGMTKNLPDSLTNPMGMSEIGQKSEGWIFGVGDKKA